MEVYWNMNDIPPEGHLLANFYAFTYKMNQAKTNVPFNRSVYTEVLKHIAYCGGYIRYVYYELDPNNHWHIHGACHFENIPKYAKLAIKGFGSKWKKIYDYSGWEDYSSKDNNEDQDIDQKDDFNIQLTSSLFKQ